MYKLEFYFQNGSILKFICEDYCESHTDSGYPVMRVVGIKSRSDDVELTTAVVFFDTVLGYTIEKLDPNYVPYEPSVSN